VKFELDKEAAAAARPERASPERRLHLVSGQGSERLESSFRFFGARRSVGFRLIRFPVAPGFLSCFVPRKDPI